MLMQIDSPSHPSYTWVMTIYFLFVMYIHGTLSPQFLLLLILLHRDHLFHTTTRHAFIQFTITITLISIQIGSHGLLDAINYVKL